MITIISGGQEGVDVAALAVAKEYGFKTFSYMPEGFLTQAGNKPEYASGYGAIEYGKGYPPRTRKNVESADLTIRIARNFHSAGEQLTLKYILDLKKHYYDIDLNYYDKSSYEKQWSIILAVVSRMMYFSDGTINIAGNSERTAPGIFQDACIILRRCFDLYQNILEEIYD